MASSRTRLRRDIVTLVLVLGALPLVALAWATWQLLEQGRELETRQRQDRVERAANEIVAELQTAIAASERAMLAGRESWSAGAVIVTLRSGGITVAQRDRVAFLPVPEPLQTGDARTAALLPRGRALANAGQHGAALQVFARLRDAPPFFIEAAPSWLAARYSRARIFERTEREADLRDEGLQLGRDLRLLATHLTSSVYELYARDVVRWTGAPLPSEPVTLSLALESLWDRWSANRFSKDESKRELLDDQGDGTVAIWHTSSDTLQALIATRAFVDAEWMPRALAVARNHGAAMTIGRRGSTASAVATRDAATSGLPWPVNVSNGSGTVDPVFSKGPIIVIAFLTLVVLMAAAGYVAIRSIDRELAVARQQSDFIASVSHEFRTPLTSLRQFVDLLREQTGLDERRRRECYDAQARSVDRLSRLVESLLDFGKLEAGTHLYRMVPRDCAALAQSVVADFTEHAQNAGYRIELSMMEGGMVNVDADAVGRALWNLLDNAMKFSPDQKTIEVGVRAAHGAVCIDVRDRGIGVGPQESRDIFRRFQRGAEARSRGIRGTGLGLAMVTEIMQAHGGRVDLDSQPGKGSTFTLVFPPAA